MNKNQVFVGLHSYHHRRHAASCMYFHFHLRIVCSPLDQIESYMKNEVNEIEMKRRLEGDREDE